MLEELVLTCGRLSTLCWATGMGVGLAMVVMVGAPGITRVGMAASMAVRCCRSRLARMYGSGSILAAAY